MRSAAEAGLPPRGQKRTHLFDPCAGTSGPRGAGVCDRRLSRRCRLSDHARGTRQRAGVASCVVVTGRADAAWFGWAAVTLSTSAIFHSFTVFPDGPGGVIALTGVWALLRAEREHKAGMSVFVPGGSRRGARGAAMDSHAIRADRGKPRRAGASAPVGHAQRGRQGGGVPGDPSHQRGVLDRILRRDLRDSRPSAPYANEQDLRRLFRAA